MTKIWLRIGFVAAAGASIATWALTSNPAAATAVGTITNLISWVATGSNPDFKSDSANVHQDVLLNLSKSLEQVAAELICLKAEDKDLAEEIASSLNIDILRRKFYSLDLALTLDLSALEAAKEYVLKDTLPDRTPVSIRALVR